MYVFKFGEPNRIPHAEGLPPKTAATEIHPREWGDGTEAHGTPPEPAESWSKWELFSTRRGVQHSEHLKIADSLFRCS